MEPKGRAGDLPPTQRNNMYSAPPPMTIDPRQVLPGNHRHQKGQHRRRPGCGRRTSDGQQLCLPGRAGILRRLDLSPGGEPDQASPSSRVETPPAPDEAARATPSRPRSACRTTQAPSPRHDWVIRSTPNEPPLAASSTSAGSQSTNWMEATRSLVTLSRAWTLPSKSPWATRS